MIEMSLPRISRISRSDAVQQLAALEVDLAGGMRRGGIGQQLQDRQRADRLAGTELADQRHAFAALDRERDAVDRSRDAARLVKRHREIAHIEQGLVDGVHHALPERLARIEGVAHGFADEDQKRQHDRDREEAGKTEPRRLHVGLALRQQFAERRRAGRQAEAEEVQRRQRHHRRRHDERQERHGRHHRVRQQMPEHDDAVGYAERPRRLDVFEIAPAQEFGAHQADQRHPGEQQENAEQHEEAGHQHRRQDQQQIKRRNRGPDLDEALEDQIDPAAEIALHAAGGDADDRRDDRQRQAEQHRDAEAIDQPRDHVAALIVGAEPVVFEIAAALEALLLAPPACTALPSASRSASTAPASADRDCGCSRNSGSAAR